MHAIVTGGGGAIGSRLVRCLLDDGVLVRVLDDFSSGFQWLLPKHPNLFVELFDISEPRSEGKLRRRITKGADVYHLAAHFANANSVEHPIRDLEVNGGGTLRVLMAASQAKAKKVVYASAGCGVGHEDTPYQIHKTMLGEAYCRYMSMDVQVAVCRFHNSYGPGEVCGKYRNVIPNWIWAAMHDEPLTIYGDGSDSRDYIFVDDLISRMIKAQTGGVTVLGTGTLTKTSKLAEMIVDLTKSKSEIVYAPRRRWDHAGQSQHQSEPFTKLEDGLKKTVAWFEEEYENIKRSNS